MTPIWRVEITPEMRESVAKGQAQFGRRETTEAVLPAPAPAEGPVTITAFDPALMGFAEREVQPARNSCANSKRRLVSLASNYCHASHRKR